MKNLSYILVAFALLGIARAEDFVEAKITKIQEQVEVLNVKDKAEAPRAATIDEILTGDNGVRTGANSRAELLFNDQTLARVGANSLFTFKEGAREVVLGRGTMLFQVPKGKGEMKITTAAVTAAITGTTGLVETNNKSYSKFIILEGTARVFLNNRLGESMLLTAGKMLILDPNARRLPEPVDVDIRKVFKTSGLIQDMDQEEGGGDGGAGGTGGAEGGTESGDGGLDMENLDGAMAEQDQLKTDGVLSDTPITIAGSGTDALIDFGDNTTDQQDTTQTSTQTNPENPINNTSRTTTLNTITSPNPLTIDGTTSFDFSTPTMTVTGTTYTGGYYEGASGDPTFSNYFFGSTSSFDTNSGFNNNINDPDPRVTPLGAFKFSNLQITALSGAYANASNIYALGFVSEGDITIAGLTNNFGLHLGFMTVNGDILVQYGAGVLNYDAHHKSLMFHARGTEPNGGATTMNDVYFYHVQGLHIDGEHQVVIDGSSFLINGLRSSGATNNVDMYSEGNPSVGGGIHITDSTFTVGRTADNQNGDIHLESGYTSATANQTVISINNSSQLQALASASAAGHILVEAQSGQIEFDPVSGDPTLEAQGTNSTIEVINYGSTGNITMNSGAYTTSLTADILKVGALGAQGQINIGKTHMTASQLMKIYGGSSSGGVTFTANTTLDGAGAKMIRGYTVQINNTVTVTANGGHLTIYTTNANYSGGGGSGGSYGSLTGSAVDASTTQPLASAPAF
ncbi:MAG: FecR domain-containing protein [Verrucomicrobiota bacterium]